MSKWDTWEIVFPNECFSTSNLADFVFACNEETKEKYNAGLDFHIFGSPGAQIPIPLPNTSLFQPRMGTPGQEFTPGTKQPLLFVFYVPTVFFKYKSNFPLSKVTPGTTDSWFLIVKTLLLA